MYQSIIQHRYHNVSTLKGLLGIVFVLSLSVTTNLLLTWQPLSALAQPSTNERILIDLTNRERAAHGLSILQYDATLTEAAYAKARDMLANDYFDHFSPDGKSPWQFMQAAGYSYWKAGENLAIDFADAKDAMPAWMASPTHKANIMKSSYNEIGIAVVKGEFKGRETTVIVQMFGTQGLLAF